jgi:hypothetical protein
VLRSFAAGLRRDLDAVVAGLTLDYNSGAVEGHREPHQATQDGDVRTCENPTFCASSYSWPEHRT